MLLKALVQHVGEVLTYIGFQTLMYGVSLCGLEDLGRDHEFGETAAGCVQCIGNALRTFMAVSGRGSA